MRLFSLLSLTVFAAGVCGCSKSGAVLDLPAASASYELVTVERPENVEAFHSLYKAAYDMCAGMRETLKLPPPAPMLRPPLDFVSQRNTYTSDGKAYLTRQEFFTYKMVAIDERNPTCKTYLETTSSTQLIRDGKVYDAGIDADGKRFSEPPSEWILPREKKSDIYPVRKSVKGHAVKCLDIAPRTKDLITELCVADLNPGTLTDATGKPLVVSSRVTIVQKMVGAVLTEPVKMQVGKPVDKAVFDAAAAH